MARTVRDVMADVKVTPVARGLPARRGVRARDARTGLGIVDVEGGGVITERDVLRAIAAAADLDTRAGRATT